ncbi:lipid A deacylase LpxR family protein [Spirosoma koreense]
MNLLYKRALLLGLLYAYVLTGFGQHPYEVKVTSENDNYCLQFHDGYYTNGLFLTVNYLPNRLNNRIREGDKLTKITASYQLGQMIFTPGIISDKITIDLIDRPYAGYLFLEKSMSFFYKRGHVLKTSLAVGTTGRNALGQQTQLFIHRLFDLVRPSGWGYQVKNEVGVNAQAQYWHKLIRADQGKKWFDVHAATQLTVGNTFTNASAGLLFQIGRFAPAHQSAFFDARIDRRPSAAQPATEFFFFFQPACQYQLYNATVEGGFFNDNRGSVVAGINHWLYRNEAGVVFSQPRWTFQLTYTFKQREAVSMKQAEQYAGLSAAYRFGQ